MGGGEVKKLLRLITGDKLGAALDEVLTIVAEERTKKDRVHCAVIRRPELTVVRSNNCRLEIIDCPEGC
jgi:hypothetical protein